MACICQEIVPDGLSQRPSPHLVSKVVRLIRENRTDAFLQCIDERVKNPSLLRTYLETLFLGIQSDCSGNETDNDIHDVLQMEVTTHVLKLCFSGTLAEDRDSGDCLSLLLRELSSLSQPSVMSILRFILEELGQNSLTAVSVSSLLDFLPRGLNIMLAGGNLNSVPSGNNHLALTQYRDEVIESLLGLAWQASWLTRMAAVVRELPLSSAQIAAMGEKLVSCFGDVPTQELPAYVYQLLLWASRCHARHVLMGMLVHFAKKDNLDVGGLSSVEYQQVLGTVVFNINFAMTQDPWLATEWLSILRGPHLGVSSFAISVLLSLAKAPHFEHQALECLRAGVHQCFHHQQTYRRSRWLSALPDVEAANPHAGIDAALLRVACYVTVAREHIMPALIRLGFLLVECAPPGACLGTLSSDDGPPELHTAEVGIQLLLQLFDKQESSRDRIVLECASRLRNPKQVPAVTRLLAKLVESQSYFVLEHLPRLKECVDHCLHLPASSAVALLSAVEPLCRLQNDLQDYVMLILRKAMFSRTEASRVTAVRGFLSLVVADREARLQKKVHENFASCSQHGSQLQLTGGSRLLFDLLGALRRCLTQQAQVRRTLYEGLPAVIIADPTTAPTVFNLILPHFRRFTNLSSDSSEESVPLRLDECLAPRDEEVLVEEPLDMLVACAFRLVALQPADKRSQQSSFMWTNFGFTESQVPAEEVGKSGADCLAEDCKSLLTNMQECYVTDFGLVGPSSGDTDGFPSPRDVSKAWLLLGVVEVLLEAVCRDMVGPEGQELTPLLSFIYALMDFLHPRGRGAKAAKPKPKRKRGAGASETPDGDDGGGLSAAPGGGGSGGGGESQAGGDSQAAPSFPARMAKAAAAARLQNKLRQRTPLLSPTCLARMAALFVRRLCSQTETQAQQSVMAIPEDLRAFGHFLFSACLQRLGPPAQHTGAGAGAGQQPAVAAVFSLQGEAADWRLLAQPLLQALEALLPLCSALDSGGRAARRRAAAATGRLDPSITLVPGRGRLEDLVTLAAQCLERLVEVGEREGFLGSFINENAEGPASEDQQASPEEIGAWLTSCLEPLVEAMVEKGAFIAAELLLRVIRKLVKQQPPEGLEPHGQWALVLLTNADLVQHGVVGEVARLVADYVKKEAALDVVRELAKVVGASEDDGLDVSATFPAVCSDTAEAVSTAYLERAEAGVADAAWLAARLKQQRDAAAAGAGRGGRGGGGGGCAATLDGAEEDAGVGLGSAGRLRLQTELHRFLLGLIGTLVLFSGMALCGPSATRLLRVAAALYKLLAEVTRLSSTPKGVKQHPPSASFLALTEAVNSKLTVNVYKLVAHLQREGGGDAKRDTKATIRREGKLVPELIFCIEEYERLLIQLSRTAGTNLMKWSKRSTARDFRIVGEGTKPGKGKRRKSHRAKSPDACEEGGAEGEGEGEGEEQDDDQPQPSRQQEDAEGSSRGRKKRPANKTRIVPPKGKNRKAKKQAAGKVTQHDTEGEETDGSAGVSGAEEEDERLDQNSGGAGMAEEEEGGEEVAEEHPYEVAEDLDTQHADEEGWHEDLGGQDANEEGWHESPPNEEPQWEGTNKSARKRHGRRQVVPDSDEEDG